MTSVVWLGKRTMCLDQHLLDQLLDDERLWRHTEAEWVDQCTCGEGAVVVVPARFYSPAQVNHFTAAMPWVVVVLTSDEESLFDAGELVHPRMRIWQMTPDPRRSIDGVRYFGEGCHHDTRQLAGAAGAAMLEAGLGRSIDVQFAGQVTHERRIDMIEAVDHLVGKATTVLATEGFAQGMPREQYLAELLEARIVLCPSGPATPDSFRIYEALEAGCVPIVDGRCPRYEADNYWPTVHPDGVPFPIVMDWSAQLAGVVDAVLANWPAAAARCQAWWLQEKRRMRHQLVDDVLEVSDLSDPTISPITAVVPTSPTPEHPQDALERIATVIDSILARLPSAEVIVVADGVRAEQEHLRPAYTEYRRLLVWACAHRWDRVTPILLDHHAHQANATRVALDLVRTPLVLFVEHDMPLVGDIPFTDMAAAVYAGDLNLVRLGQDREAEHYEAMMLDTERLFVGPRALPVLRTFQWSQRPHLASTAFYRDLIGKYFGVESRTMIEDVMHGVVATAWAERGIEGWEQFKLALFHPPGDPTRSRHLDGRGAEPKFDMLYAYDGPTPDGAPAPTAGRDDQ